MDDGILLLFHASCAWMMTGLVLFVQVVHYPLLTYVGREEFASYIRQHQAWTSWIVAPIMGLEAMTAGLLIAWFPDAMVSSTFMTAVALLIVIWASTVFWQVPIHVKLTRGYQVDHVRNLVRSNWLRTIAWSARSLILGGMLAVNYVARWT